MARRKKQDPSAVEQEELKPRPALESGGAALASAPGSGGAEGAWEYPGPDGGLWRVERVDLFRVEFPSVPRERLPEFHRLLALDAHARGWMIVRRLFGVMPLRVPLGGNPDDFRVWSRAELREVIGCSEKELKAELDGVRSAFVPDAVAVAPSAASLDLPMNAEGERVLLETDDEVLRKYQFSTLIFDKEGREPSENTAERAWFAGRVREWEKLFKAAMTQRAATQCLYTELRLRRAESESWDLQRRALPMETTQRAALESLRNKLDGRIGELEETYRAQLDSLQELAPWFNVTGKQISVTGAFGELVKACQEWEAREDRRMVDGIFTALELQVQLRTHTLMPEPMYRSGWVTYINESRRWLWDPTATSQFKPKDLEVLDRAWKEAVRAYNELHHIRVPDLLADGPEGELGDIGKV